MTLKSNWSVASDDENSRQSFLSDCDSEFDLCPPPRYAAEKHSISTLNKLSIHRNEPPLTRSRAKASGETIINSQLVPKERRRSTIRNSIDSLAGLTATFTNSILFPKHDLSNNRSPISPTDGVNTLTDWLESCSLDESKFSKNCLWPSRETNSHYMRPIISSSPNVTLDSNSFSLSQTSPLFVQSSSTTTLFGQQAQLWSRFRFAASTIRNNLWVEQIDPTPSNLFTSSNSHFSDQSPMFTSSSSNILLSSLSPQTVPSLLTKTSSSSMEELSPPLLRQRQMVNSEASTKKQDIIIQQSSSSKIFFTLTIFAVGLVLGYFLTNTCPPNLIHHWFFVLWETCVEISIKSFHLLYIYSQTVMKYFSSFA